MDKINKKVVIVISIFVVLTLLGVCIISYNNNSNIINDIEDINKEDDNKENNDNLQDDLISDNKEENNENYNDENIKTIDFSKLKEVEYKEKDNVKQFIEIIDKQLYILLNKKSISEITNQEKLQIALESYSDNVYGHASINAEDLEKAYKNTVLGNIDFYHDNIIDYYKLRVFYDTLYTYDKNKNVYFGNNIGHGVVAPYPIYTRITDYKEENNKYIVSAKFVFTTRKGDGPSNLDLYYKYNDVVTDKPFIKGPDVYDSVDENEYKNNIIMYILNNYSDIESNLMTYTYTFEKKDNKLFLVDFNVK